MSSDDGERLIERGNEKTLTYGEHWARYLSVIDIVKNKIVLDIACGSGYGTELVSKKAKKVYGIDNAKEAIKYSTQHHTADNIEYIIGDAQDIPLNDDSIDIIISFETIEHLKDPNKFLKESKRVLKKNGSLIISTPNTEEFMQHNAFHIHEFKYEEFKNLLGKYYRNTDLYFQGTWFSTSICSEEGFKKAYRNVVQPVTKTFSMPTKKAVFFIAAVSDTHPPKLVENMVISDVWSMKEDLARTSYNMSLLAIEKEQTADLTKRLESSESLLNHILKTKWWRARAGVVKFRNRVSGKG